MTLPLFDANVYLHADTQSGTFPQQREQREQRGEGRPMGDGGGQTGEADHGWGQTGTTSHGGDPAGTTGHGGDQASGLTPSPDQTQSRSFIRRFTVATSYVATGLLVLTLLIGPANLLLRRRNPVSNYLTRDVGTWAAIFSVVHVFYGLQVHGSGQILNNVLDYFVAPDGSPLTNSFGLANWTGLAATVIVVGLLAISSDFALRKLKARTWKNLQRLNYTLFALVIVHAFFYGVLLRMDSPYTLLLLLSVIAVFAGQAVGVWLWRQRHARTTARLA
ncbi:MAG: ferric reductase-like transmembrane domain-containing protein [Chloroflexi bacterium]|nr:ferric reductase-like transmembrane domain-containing protein [Chloroflexota bacterium]